MPWLVYTFFLNILLVFMFGTEHGKDEFLSY